MARPLTAFWVVTPIDIYKQGMLLAVLVYFVCVTAGVVHIFSRKPLHHEVEISTDDATQTAIAPEPEEQEEAHKPARAPSLWRVYGGRGQKKEKASSSWSGPIRRQPTPSRHAANAASTATTRSLSASTKAGAAGAAA